MASQPDRRQQAEDLIREQQDRWEAGQPKSVSDFVTEHPWLRSELRALVQMIRAEVAEREQAGPVDFSEYALLAPELGPALANALPAATVSLPPTTPGPRGARNPQSQRESPAMSAGSAARFQVIRSHAKGGLGEVFVASDREFNREVALKQIQNRLAGQPDARSRFVLEAEITGLLEHPGIVPVYSMGAYADGNPFYAMRFIRGESLRDAIKKFHSQPFQSDSERSVEFRKLLGRFVSVCHAIGYAHSRGVLHRDLKPDNIMLGDYGETLVVDWGLATALANSEQARAASPGALPRIEPHTLSEFEQVPAGQIIGTPTYMSPEQAVGKGPELGPESDIYSLGATLFTLLTGDYAYSGKDRTEVLDQVRAGQIRRPSDLKPNTPKPLEAICLKALSLEPGDRYPTALAVAEEIERWLADEPVQAYPEPLGVRARRWMRKHPSLVSSLAATIVLGLLSAATFAVLQGQYARELALKNLTITKQNEELTSSNATISQQKQELEITNVNLTQARAEAVQEKEEAESVTDFLVKSFRQADRLRHGKDLAAHELLIRAQGELAEQPNVDPLHKARILHAIGQSFLGLGVRDKAIEAGADAFSIRQRLLGKDHPETLNSMHNLAHGYLDAAQFETALPMFEEILKLRRAKLGEHHRDTLVSMSTLAKGQLQTGKVDLAITLMDQTLQLMHDHLGADDPDTINTLVSAGSAYQEAGRFDLAVPMLQRALQSQQSYYGKDHPATLAARGNLAQAYEAAGNFQLAVTLNEATLRLSKERLGEEHPKTILTMNNLGGSYQRAGKQELALPMHSEAVRLAKKKLGDQHPVTAMCIGGLANHYLQTNQRERALVLYEEALQIQRSVLGKDHSDTITSLANLAATHQSSGRPELALPLYEEALRRRQESLGDDHPETLVTRKNLAATYKALGQPEKALEMETETVALMKAKLGEDHPTTLNGLNNLGMTYQALGNHEGAALILADTLHLRRQKLGDDHQSTLESMHNLAGAYMHLGQLDQAVPLFEEAVGRMRKNLGDTHELTLNCLSGLAQAYLKAGRFEPAQTHYDEFLDRKRKLASANDPAFAVTLTSVAMKYLAAGQYPQSEACLQEALTINRAAAPDDWSTFLIQSLLGASLLGQRKFDDAEPLLLAGYRGLKDREETISIRSRGHLKSTLKCLVDMYKAWDKPTEAAQWQAELDARVSKSAAGR